MESVLLYCPTCKRALTEEHLMGKYFRCPACKNEYLYQDGILSIHAVTLKYYPIEKTWEDFLYEAFQPLEGVVSADFFKELHVLLKDEVYLPFVDVVTPDGQSFLTPIPQKNGSFVWDDDDIPWNIDSALLKNVQSSDKPQHMTDVSKVRYIAQSSELLEQQKQQSTYVSNEVYYIPVKIIKFSYKGSIYRMVNCGSKIFSTGESLDNIVAQFPRNSNESIPKWVGIVLTLLQLAVFVSAWMEFCYSYQQINGLSLLFFYNTGYKCLFHFLGTCFVAIFARLVVDKSLSLVYADMRLAHQNTTKLTMRQEELRVFTKS